MIDLIPKRGGPPILPGVYYFSWPELRESMANPYVYFVVIVTWPNHRDLGLYGTVLNVRLPGMNHSPIIAFPEGDWYGPLPEPDNNPHRFDILNDRRDFLDERRRLPGIGSPYPDSSPPPPADQ